MQTSKLNTFMGFVMKTGKYKIGLNAIATLKRALLIIVCDSASLNTKKEAIKFSARFHCPAYIAKTPLEELTHRQNAKIMAIYEKKLTLAIIENCGVQLEIFKQERTDG